MQLSRQRCHGVSEAGPLLRVSNEEAGHAWYEYDTKKSMQRVIEK